MTLLKIQWTMLFYGNGKLDYNTVQLDSSAPSVQPTTPLQWKSELHLQAKNIFYKFSLPHYVVRTSMWSAFSEKIHLLVFKMCPLLVYLLKKSIFVLVIWPLIGELLLEMNVKNGAANDQWALFFQGLSGCLWIK